MNIKVSFGPTTLLCINMAKLTMSDFHDAVVYVSLEMGVSILSIALILSIVVGLLLGVLGVFWTLIMFTSHPIIAVLIGLSIMFVCKVIARLAIVRFGGYKWN